MTRACRRLRSQGFTLVELLVVIGIIAILIGILLPGLASARRSANRVKCAAALKEIHNAFQFYSNENKGYYPVAVHEQGNTKYPTEFQHRWYEMVAKYITKTAKDWKDYQDIVKIRQNSVLWGCPEWGRRDYAMSAGDDVRPGYGLHYYTGKYFDNTTTAKFQTDYAYITATQRGTYVKQGQWANGRSAEKGLLIDSMTHIVNVPGFSTYTYAAVQAATPPGWQPAQSGAIETGVASNLFYVEAGRHLKTGVKVNDRVQGMNMLFCDGHVAAVSVREAWSAITLKQPEN